MKPARSITLTKRPTRNKGRSIVSGATYAEYDQANNIPHRIRGPADGLFAGVALASGVKTYRGKFSDGAI